jgi:hypothetical protein
MLFVDLDRFVDWDYIPLTFSVNLLCYFVVLFREYIGGIFGAVLPRRKDTKMKRSGTLRKVVDNLGTIIMHGMLLIAVVALIVAIILPAVVRMWPLP